ncbi:type II toxin-antitoxin system death-on-curing family toxin, partial [Salmonella enterica subsp. enterica]|nr:type II toxin-antitoxin system death-on-curing family toxin [Salmonella enterica subsp. enterica]
GNMIQALVATSRYIRIKSNE